MFEVNSGNEFRKTYEHDDVTVLAGSKDLYADTVLEKEGKGVCGII